MVDPVVVVLLVVVVCIGNRVAFSIYLRFSQPANHLSIQASRPSHRVSEWVSEQMTRTWSSSSQSLHINCHNELSGPKMSTICLNGSAFCINVLCDWLRRSQQFSPHPAAVHYLLEALRSSILPGLPVFQGGRWKVQWCGNMAMKSILFKAPLNSICKWPAKDSMMMIMMMAMPSTFP